MAELDRASSVNPATVSRLASVGIGASLESDRRRSGERGRLPSWSLRCASGAPRLRTLAATCGPRDPGVSRGPRPGKPTQHNAPDGSSPTGARPSARMEAWSLPRHGVGAGGADLGLGSPPSRAVNVRRRTIEPWARAVSGGPSYSVGWRRLSLDGFSPGRPASWRPGLICRARATKPRRPRGRPGCRSGCRAPWSG